MQVETCEDVADHAQWVCRISAQVRSRGTNCPYGTAYGFKDVAWEDKGSAPLPTGAERGFSYGPVSQGTARQPTVKEPGSLRSGLVLGPSPSPCWGSRGLEELLPPPGRR